MLARKTIKKITRRKGEFARYQIEWYDICHQCNPSPPKKSKGEVKGYLMPRWEWDENNHLKLYFLRSYNFIRG